MRTYDLRFSVVGTIAAHSMPTQPLMLQTAEYGEQSLSDVFFKESGGAVNLNVNPQYPFLVNDSSITSVSTELLHTTLQNTVRNAVGEPASQLAVLFAPRWADNDSVLGVMFDIDFGPDGVPREGCAVFLGNIRSLRDDDNYRKQVSYDIVHELGHVFNLQHIDPGVDQCYLNVSPEKTAPPPERFRFSSDERTLLAVSDGDGPDAQAIFPGGSSFGDLGAWANEDRGFRRRSIAPEVLQLNLSMNQKEFWPWEPVELEIQVRRGPKWVKSQFHIPNEIDPGYRNFEIWIEEPSGERRLYRPTKWFCSHRSYIEIEPGPGFRRDVSIFGQSGGYTFRRGGVHRIWAILYINSVLRLESRPFEVLVRSRVGLDSRAQSRVNNEQALCRSAARIFFYRSGRIRPKEIDALETIITRFPKTPLQAASHYALGRLFLHKAMRMTKQRKRWESRALPHLEAAGEHEFSSPNRRRRARECATKITDSLIHML